MKYIPIIFLLLVTICCKAQNIVPLYDNPIDRPENAYLKDLDNDLTDFVGTWLWADGSSSITMEFQKIEMISTSLYLTDVLIGEYEYILNGQEILNSLPVNYNGNPQSHHIYGGVITTVHPDQPPCNGCGIGSDPRYVVLGIEDVNTDGIRGQLIMTYYVESGIEKIVVRLSNTFNENLEVGYTGPLILALPEGDYTFIKQ